MISCDYYIKLPFLFFSNVKVKLQMEKGKEVTIVGLDEFGYLKTIDENKKTIIVHDDGNSFDMMHNLIKMK